MHRSGQGSAVRPHVARREGSPGCPREIWHRGHSRKGCALVGICPPDWQVTQGISRKPAASAPDAYGH